MRYPLNKQRKELDAEEMARQREAEIIRHLRHGDGGFDDADPTLGEGY